MCGSEDEKISKVEESIEILRIRCLIKNKQLLTGEKTYALALDEKIVLNGNYLLEKTVFLTITNVFQNMQMNLVTKQTKYGQVKTGNFVIDQENHGCKIIM